MPLTPSVDRYRILHLLGVGGMGIVYRAEDVTLRRPVALKFLAPEIALDDEYRARFLREARVAASFNHPNTCVVYEVGELEAAIHLPEADTVAGPGTLFIAMELVEGNTLAAKLAESGPFAVAAAIDIALQVADGLAEAHSKGIVHRDLKPQNVMITPNGRVKIVDFGLAKPVKPVRGELTTTSEMISADIGAGQVLGTCAYMSPEQVTGKTLDARSDVFAFGITLYEMVSGRLPFRGDSATETLAKILETEPLPLAGEESAGSKALAQLIQQCLQKKPADRYGDAREVLRELRQAAQLIAADDASPGRVPRRVPPVAASLRTRLVVSAAVPLVLLAAYPIVRSIANGSPAAVINPTPDTETKTTPPIEVDSKPEAPPAQPPQSPAPSLPISHTAAKVPPHATSPREGSLAISSNPRASVTIDGNLVGITPLTLETSVGTHEIVLTGSDGASWRGRVDALAGEQIPVERDLSATGSLSVVSDFWVEVSLDDRPVEQTPIHFARLAAGLHTLRASRPGYVTEVHEIFIEESKAESLRITLEKEP